MKRDMELTRKILLTIEDRHDPQDDSSMAQSFIFTLEGGYSESEVDYNLSLLLEADLVNGRGSWSMGGTYHVALNGLTWAGHDFLDAIRQDVVWQGVQDKAKQAGLSAFSLSFEVLKNLAVSVAKEHLGLHE